MTAVSAYFDRFWNEEDTTVPDAKALLPISRVLDTTAKGVIEEMMEVLRSSQEHQARVATLHAQPRLAKKFKASKIILKDASSFEQMVAVADWLSATNIQKMHSFFLSSNDEDYIPVQVKKFSNATTMMHVLLGSTSGSHKAPRYADWAVTDPWDSEAAMRFIHPLEALEIVRQPQFSCATLIKGNAFETYHISTSWRYGSTYACVEDAGQSRVTKKKERSAGLNAAALTHHLADASDPLAEETSITPEVEYESYSTDGYLDDLDIGVSPGDLIKATEQALKQDTADLVRLMENLMISKIEIPRTPVLCDYIAQKLIANNV